MTRPAVLFLAWPQYDAAEIEFWQDLQRALGAHGLDILLLSTTPPPAGLAIEHVGLVPNVDCLWRAHTESPLSVTALGLNPEVLLAREEEWSGPAVLTAVRDLRRQALDEIASHTVRLMSTIQPVVVVIWNGQHVPELILDAACRQVGIPVLYVERAPIPRALFADEAGLSAASTLAQQREWPVPAAPWLRRADEVSKRIARGNLTWWAQPEAHGAAALRRELKVRNDQRVILFAGQVDEDMQRVLFSPTFPDNVHAWRWLLQSLQGRADVFVLGKHHPKASTAPEAYAQVLAASGVPGVWHTDLAIDDALAVADRVAAVNSTVLYEASARGIPSLAMGQWLLGGRGVAHEVRDRASGLAAVDAWLAAADVDVRRARWQEALGYVLSQSVYAYEREASHAGSLGAPDLAARIAGLRSADATPHTPHAAMRLPLTQLRSQSWRDLGQPEPPSLSNVDDDPLVTRWKEAHTLKWCICQARAAALRGRHILIWGTDHEACVVKDLLAEAGVPLTAFVTSQARRPTLFGVPVVDPSGLSAETPRDFVLVASIVNADIFPALTSKGFVYGDDLLAIDCAALARLVPDPRAVAC